MMRFALFLSLFLLSRPLYAEDNAPVETCLKCVDAFLTDASQALDEWSMIQEHGFSYPNKIRWLYYNKIWKARQLRQDPLSQERRREGEALEAKWLRLRDKYQESWLKKLKDLSQEEDRIRIELPQALMNCLNRTRPFMLRASVRLNDWTRLIDEVQDIVVQIKDLEESLTKRVITASGGWEGTYFYDSMEKPEQHSSYYERFEIPIERKRYKLQEQREDSLCKLWRLLEDERSWHASCHESNKRENS